MPTTTAATKRFHLRMPIGLGEKSTAKVTFVRQIPIRASAPTPAIIRWTEGRIGAHGDAGDPGIAGIMEDGTITSGTGVVLGLARRLTNAFKQMPGAAILKTDHGNLGVLAGVQPGEPATGSMVQALSPSVDAVDAVAVEA